METSELRKRILRALDEARLESVSKRGGVDAAQQAYEQFLANIAVPLLKQAQSILKAENKPFTVHTPAGSAKLVSDSSAQNFVEFVFDRSPEQGTVLGRVSRARGRQRVIVDERPVATDKAIAALTEEDVAAFLVTEIPKLVGR